MYIYIYIYICVYLHTYLTHQRTCLLIILHHNVLIYNNQQWPFQSSQGEASSSKSRPTTNSEVIVKNSLLTLSFTSSRKWNALTHVGGRRLSEEFRNHAYQRSEDQRGRCSVSELQGKPEISTTKFTVSPFQHVALYFFSYHPITRSRRIAQLLMERGFHARLTEGGSLRAQKCIRIIMQRGVGIFRW